MLNEALSFWEAISGKVKQLIRGETKNVFRTERYEVTTAPDGTKIGVTLPFGTNEIFLPYSAELRYASVGDSVLVVWWGSMSNAKAYYYADGYRGNAVSKMGTVTLPLSWNTVSSGIYTDTPTLTGATVTSNSKIDLQATAAQINQLKNLGVAAIYIENNNGTLTAYSVGAAPNSALTLQCTVTEVMQ